MMLFIMVPGEGWVCDCLAELSDDPTLGSRLLPPVFSKLNGRKDFLVWYRRSPQSLLSAETWKAQGTEM